MFISKKNVKFRNSLGLSFTDSLRAAKNKYCWYSFEKEAIPGILSNGKLLRLNYTVIFLSGVS